MNLTLLNRAKNSSAIPQRNTSTLLSTLAISSALLVYILIIYGSHVRVTDSGMGCPDWPLCKGSVGPFQGFHAFMEQTHRYLAGVVSILVVATAAVAARTRSHLSAIKPAFFTVALVLVQVILGAITVFDGNGAPTVAAHLLAGLGLLGGATITAVATLVPKRKSDGQRLGNIAWTAIASAGLLYISGSLIVNAEAEKACASFPFCPTDQPQHLVLLHILHRSIAFFAIIALIVFALHAWRNWQIYSGARALSMTLVALMATTAALGIISALLRAPSELQDLHLAGAAAVLVAAVTLATLGWLGAGDSSEKGPLGQFGV